MPDVQLVIAREFAQDLGCGVGGIVVGHDHGVHAERVMKAQLVGEDVLLVAHQQGHQQPHGH